MCIRSQRKGKSIPATDKAVQLQDDFDAYVALMTKGSNPNAADRKRREIERGLEQIARAQQLMKMLAGAGLTPWVLRRMHEIERDLEDVA